MTQTALCADGLHERCSGGCTKWCPDRDDEVIERFDGGTRVRCTCNCHQEEASG